ncbi:hypothetical protein [Paenibacillus sp. CMAA1364]
MDSITRTYFDHLEAEDKNLQYEAFNHIIVVTEDEVNWAYEVWDQFVGWLTDKDNHRRARATQILSSLAISDPEQRMLKDFPALWQVTKDPKFVTARHSLQSIWKVGLAGSEQKDIVIQHMVDRFKNGTHEKHYTLIRYDMIQGLKKLYDKLQDEGIRRIAMELIDMEEDITYRKKYMSVWR